MDTPMQRELPEHYVDKIENISEKFAENLKRAFNNEGIRLRKLHRCVELPNVAYSADNIYVELNDINMNYPEFRLNDLIVDLKQPVVKFRLTIGKFQFRSKMQTITRTLFNGMYTVAPASVLWTLNHIQITACIGLNRQGDAFVPTNTQYFFFFEHGEIEQYIGDNPFPETSTFANKDFSLFRIVQADFEATLARLIDRQIEVIGEFAASELLLDDRDAIAHYGAYLNRRALRGNLLVDHLVNRAKAAGLLAARDTLPTRIGMPFKQARTATRHLLIADGRISGMSTLTRLRDCSLCETPQTLRVYGQLALKDYRFVYDYATEYNGFKVRGTIAAKVYKNVWTVEMAKFERDDPVVVLTVDRLCDIEIDYANLGALTWLARPLRTLLIGHIKSETCRRVKDHLSAKLQSAAIQIAPMIRL